METKLKFVSENGKDVTEKIIEEFAKSTQYFTNNEFSRLLTGEIKNNNLNYLDIISDIYEKNSCSKNYPYPLIIIFKEKMIFEKFYIEEKDSAKHKNAIDYYLRIIQGLSNIKNKLGKNIGELKSLLTIIEENDFITTNDIFTKMILILYRIQANIPVIIMGETGCGKTELVLKLNQILNNGKTMLEIININNEINNEILSKIMKEKNEISKKQKDTDEFWIFFNGINKSSCLGLIKEIFMNRTYNGNKINDNIRLIAACNPYRKIRQNNNEKYYLNFSYDNNNDDKIVYKVKPLPQSLLYYTFNFNIMEKMKKKNIYINQ